MRDFLLWRFLWRYKKQRPLCSWTVLKEAVKSRHCPRKWGGWGRTQATSPLPIPKPPPKRYEESRLLFFSQDVFYSCPFSTHSVPCSHWNLFRMHHVPPLLKVLQYSPLASLRKRHRVLDHGLQIEFHLCTHQQPLLSQSPPYLLSTGNPSYPSCFQASQSFARLLSPWDIFLPTLSLWNFVLSLDLKFLDFSLISSGPSDKCSQGILCLSL